MDIKRFLGKIIANKNHPSAETKILKLLLLAHQSVNDQLAGKHGIHQDKMWVSEVIFGDGFKKIPESNIYYRLLRENQD